MKKPGNAKPRHCIILLLLFAGIQLNAQVAPSGNGTEAEPYEIATRDNLLWLSGNSDEWDKHFIQTDDIDASATSTWNDDSGFAPIGTYITLQDNTPFTGSYNGDGHTITGLTINRPSTDGVAMFAYTEGANIENLGLVNVSIVGSELVSALVGRTGETTIISNCFSTGAISSGSYYGMVGGLIGYHAGSSSIENSYSMATITGTRSGGTRSLGGLIGSTHISSVTNCYSTGLVSGGTESVGGLIGYSMATVINSFWDTETSGQTTSAAGTGKTTSEMQTASLYTQAGWDFMDETANGTDDVWGINSAENNGYPFLAWQGYTNDAELTLSTQYVTNISTTALTATANGTIYSLGTPAPEQHGVCWNTTGTPTLSDNYSEEGVPSTGSFTAEMTGLTLHEVYYVRAYATNDNETVYGNEVSFAVTSAVAPSAGDGSQSSPYEIASLENLLWLSENNSEWNKYFIQTADIVASATQHINDGSGFSPIGNASAKFTGNYNGQSHTIDGLFINRPSSDNIGLFGYVNSLGTIKNLGMINTTVSGGSHTGALVGQLYSSNALIENCYSIGTVTGFSYTGGLIGWLAYGTMNSCYSNVDVLGVTYIGCLVGRVQGGKVYNSYSFGSVAENTGTGSSTSAGGFAGAIDNSAIVSNCYSTASVGSANSHRGGFVGYYSTSTVTNCFWDTETSGMESSPAGTGENTSDMKDNSTFFNAGWDFVSETDNGTNDYWDMDQDGTVNNGYPILSWQDGADDLIFPPVTWTGLGTPNQWNDPGNWTSIPPEDIDDVVIPSGLVNYPVLHDRAARCNNLIIEEGASLTIKSDPMITGSLIVKGTATGTITVERYLNTDRWYLVGSPVRGQNISSFLANAQNHIAYKNENYGATTYNEAIDDWENYFTLSTSGNFENGRSYLLRRQDLSGVVTFNGTPATGEVNVPVTNTNSTNGWNSVGNPYTSAIRVRPGINLTLNFLAENADILDDNYEALYIWDESLGYENAEYVIVSNAGFTNNTGKTIWDTDYLQLGQGFIIKANADGNVTFTPEMQSDLPWHPLKSTEKSWPGIIISASANGSVTSAGVTFYKGMSEGLDPGYDAGAFKSNSELSVFTQLAEDNGHDFGLQCLPESALNGTTIPVGIETTTGGEISIGIEKIGLPSNLSVWFEDKLNGVIREIKTTEEFVPVTIDPNEEAYGRFYLSVGKSTNISELKENRFSAWHNEGKIIISGKIKVGSDAVLYDMQGRKLMTVKLNDATRNNLEVGNIKDGIYLLRIFDGKEYQILKVPVTRRS